MNDPNYLDSKVYIDPGWKLGVQMRLSLAPIGCLSRFSDYQRLTFSIKTF